MKATTLRRIVFTLLITLVLSAAACGKTSSETNTNSESTLNSETAASDKSDLSNETDPDNESNPVDETDPDNESNPVDETGQSDEADLNNETTPVDETGQSDEADLNNEVEPGDETKEVRIIATSDLHGKFYPWDYALNEESTAGSVSQLASALKEYRNENTLLVDAGDSIQDNSADIFLDEEIHPMIRAINMLGYDIWVTGNHEYDFGLSVTKKTIDSFAGTALTGNVYDPEGNPLADGYTIIEKNGIRIAVIGMVTPNIMRLTPHTLEGCTVTDPVEESRKIIDSIEGQYDVLLGVMHMSIENEFNAANTGVRDLAEACPEFDVIVASHMHRLVEGMNINDVLVVESREHASSMSVIDITLKKTEAGWDVAGKESESVLLADYQPDPEFLDAFAAYDQTAKEDAQTVIAVFDGDSLAPENEIREIPTALIEDTALMDLICNVMKHFSGADIAAAALSTYDANLYRGDIRKCDLSHIYKFMNSLSRLQMTGSQLKKYMEWSVSYYNQYHPGDLTISFNENTPLYNYDMFSDVHYEINIANEPGNRIENLTWPDGREVKDTDTFTIAVCGYRANSMLLVPGVIYEEGDMPVLLESDIRSDIGGIREQIGRYIDEEFNGVLTPVCDNSWKITGNDWDEELHQKVVELAADGTIEIPSSADGAKRDIRSITEADLP